MKKTTVSNKLNSSRYTVKEIKGEESKEIHRQVKEKEREFLHLIYHTYNQKQDFEPLQFTFLELKKFIGINTMDREYIKNLISGCLRLTTKFKRVNDEEAREYNIFSFTAINEEEEYIKVKFNNDLLDYLYCDKDIKKVKEWSQYKNKKLTLTTEDMKKFKEKHKGGFTVTSHIELTRLKSKYSMELYEKLSQFKTSGEKEYLLSELRDLLFIPGSYSPNMIKTRILEVSKKQINENTSLDIDYEITGGRGKQKVKFIIKLKKRKTVKCSVEVAPPLQKPEESQEPVKNEELEKYKADILELAKKQIKENRVLKVFNVVIRTANRKENIDKMVLEYGITRQLPGTEEK